MAPPSDSNFFSSTVEERSEGVVEDEWSMMVVRAGDGRERRRKRRERRLFERYRKRRELNLENSKVEDCEPRQTLYSIIDKRKGDGDRHERS